MDIPRAVDLWEGFFREKSVNFLAGEEGVGKSMLAMNLGIAVATGADRFLHAKLNAVGSVLYLNAELNDDDCIRRFQTMTRLLPGNQGSLEHFLLPREVRPIAECWKQLCELLELHKPKVLIADPLYFLHSDDENDNSDMKTFVRMMLQLRDTYGLCIVIVHHLKKGGRGERLNSEMMRGASVLGGAADSVLVMRRSQTDESKRILKLVKSRHASDEGREPRLLSLNPENLWLRDEGVCAEEDHVAAPLSASESVNLEDIFGEHEELSMKQIQDACPDVSRATIFRVVNKAVEKGELQHAARGQYRKSQVSLPKGMRETETNSLNLVS
jgi:RecA-family ATPase